MQDERKNENKQSSVEQEYQERFDTALSRPLTVDAIDTYADRALEEVVHIVSDVTRKYDQLGHDSDPDAKTKEDIALEYFGLPQVNSTLDYLAQKSGELRAIDGIILSAPVIDRIIIPPDPMDASIEAGDGSFEEKEHIPRLKTLLFILANEFGQDVNDAEKVLIRRGLVIPTMMRGESYYSVDAFGVDRTVMVCDESGNATLVFDRKKMEAYGITSDDLMGLRKSELHDLMETNPDLGERIVYSPQFVKNMVNALRGDEDVAQVEAASYLVSLPPEGYMSINALAVEFGVTAKTIHAAIAEVGEELGETQKYRFASHVTLGYSPAQQAKILDRLEERGNLAEFAPEGFLTIDGVSQLFGVTHKTVRAAAEELVEELGKITIYRSKAGPKPHLSPDQQAVLQGYLSERGVLAEPVPDGYLSIGGFAHALSVSGVSVQKAVDALGDTLGEIKRYKFTSIYTFALSPHQQELVLGHLEAKGYLSGPVPEGYRSKSGIAEESGLSPRTIQRALKEIGDRLGHVGLYKFGPRLAEAYSPEQQETIWAYLESKYMFAEQPEGYVSPGRFGDELGVSASVVIKAAAELKDAIGPVRVYKSTHRTGEYLSPEQQQAIRDYLQAEGYFDKMPEGYLTENGIATLYDTSNHSVNRIVGNLGPRLGEVQSYKTEARVTKGYSPEQVALIHAEMVEEGFFLDPAPEGYLALSSIAHQLDLSPTLLFKAADALVSELGEVLEYRFAHVAAKGYSPAQQEILRRFLEAEGYTAPRAPEGYLSVSAFAKSISLDRSTVYRVTQTMSGLGELNKYKFGSKITEGLSPEQQRMVYDELERAGKLVEAAPDSVLSTKAFALQLGIAGGTLEGIAEKIANELGELKSYNFANNIVKGFDRTQQERIRRYLDESSPLGYKEDS